MKLKLSKIPLILVIISGIIFTVKVLDNVHSWNDLFWVIFGIILFICILDEPRFQAVERQKLLEKIKVDRFLGVGEFAPKNPAFDENWPKWKRMLLNIFIFIFLFGIGGLLLSFIIFPILTSGNN